MKKMLTVLLALVLMLGMTAIGTAAPTEEGLIVYYSFDDDSETVANGGSAEADGTASNVTYAEGAVGNAAVFNGMDSSIEFTLAEGMPSFTISIWVNVEDIPTDDAVPYAIVCSTIWDNSAVHMHITDGILRGSMASWKNADYLDEEYTHTREDALDWADTPSMAGKWFHVALTMDGDTKTRCLYVNGTLVGEDVADSVDANLLKGTIEIGSWKSDMMRYFYGMLDEFRLYDRALTQDEVRELTAQVENVDVVPEPTPRPEPTATPTATADDEPTSAATASNNTQASSTARATQAAQATSSPAPEESSGSMTWLWIVLVVAVVLAIVLFVVFKKKKK